MENDADVSEDGDEEAKVGGRRWSADDDERRGKHRDVHMSVVGANERENSCGGRGR